jgi:tryptophanyl-tRNA synthetase
MRRTAKETKATEEKERRLTTGAEGKKRVVSGMRPTGRLHIGHYFGALENWVRLQNAVLPDRKDAGLKPSATTAWAGAREYECFYFIADWHALTSDYADTSGVAQNTIEIMTDYLAAGLDPEKSVIFQQSLVPEHAELHLLLSMVTPLGWLERVPTYKEALENVKDKDLHNYGFLGYPVLQCADIVIYSEGAAQLYVPVGEDQVSHVEISREIVRRFNLAYSEVELPHVADEDGWAGVASEAGMLSEVSPRIFVTASNSYSDKRAVLLDVYHRAPLDLRATYVANGRWKLTLLVEPDSMLTKTPRIPGLDGRKMSKSYGNAITLSETDEEIRKKTKVMVTDPARKRRTDPGNPDVCPVYDWHKLFSAQEPGRLEWVRQGCTTAGIGCIECKSAMAENLIKWIAPVRERRVEYEKNPRRVLELIDEGSKRARVEAKKTMERVREAVFHWKDKRAEVGGASAKSG